MKDFDEMRNIDLEQEPSLKPKKERKKGGFFSKFVAWLLGFVIGILGALGGVAFFGWYFYAKMPIEKTTNTLGGLLNTEIDYSQYIDKSYGEKTLANLVGDTLSAVDKVSAGEGTFNTLNAISPLVGKLVKGENGEGGLVNTLAQYAIKVDPDKAMDRILVKPEGTPDVEENKDIYFGDYLKSCVDEAPLGDMIKALGYESNDVIQTICYGMEGVDYVLDENGEVQMINGATKLTVKEFLSEDLNEHIKHIPIDSFMTISFPDDAVMCMLAYGAEYRYEKTLDENGNVVMTQVFYEYTYNEESQFILLDDEGNDVTANIVSGADNPKNGIVLTHTYTQNEQEISETRYLLYNETEDKYYAFEDAEYTKPVKFQKNTVGMLSDGSSNLIDKMFIKDLLNIDETDESVMIALCYGKQAKDGDDSSGDWKYDENGKIQMLNGAQPRTVKQLKEGKLINELTLKDLLGEDVENNQILSNLSGSTIETLAQDMEVLTFKDVFADKIYEDEAHTQIKPMWKYLFDNPDTKDTMETPDKYFLLGGTSDSTNDKLGVDQMITNMQTNMQTSSLKKLVEDDMIVFEDDLSTPDVDESVTKKEEFLNSDKELSDGTVINEMTIIDMINWIMNQP